jgi:hypothetical protein
MEYDEFLGLLLDGCDNDTKEETLNELMAYFSKNYTKSAETPETRFIREIKHIVDKNFEKYLKKWSKPVIDISGKYSVNSTAETVTIEQKGIECIVSSTTGWKGQGYVTSNIYRGTYEYPGNGTGEHLMLIKKDKNLVGIWHSETHGSEKIEWIKTDGKFIPYPPRSGDAYDMNAPFEEH